MFMMSHTLRHRPLTLVSEVLAGYFLCALSLYCRYFSQTIALVVE